MKRYNFERKIIAARPEEYASNRHFTDSVMEKITKSEIFSSQIRSMSDTKQGTLIMKLRHMPKLAVIGIAIGGLLLLSGTAYAAYQLLWAKPAVELNEMTTSPSGREQAVLSTKECGATNIQHYELKKNATITADRIPAIVQAQCELKAIETWAFTNYQGEYVPEPTDGSPYDYESVRVSMATRLQDKQKDTITFAANDITGMPVQTLKVPSDILYIADGKEADSAAINSGDPVVYVVKSKLRLTKTESGGYSGGGMPEETLVAVVKLSMPFEDYDQFAWQSIAERQPCYGNTHENCLPGGASIDLYMGGNPNAPEGTIMKQIQGVVTAIEGNTVLLQASSGTIYRVTTPTDVIKHYNDNKAAQHYNNQRVTIGSSLSVDYNEAENEHSTMINASYMRFMIELISKGDPVKAY